MFRIATIAALIASNALAAPRVHAEVAGEVGGLLVADPLLLAGIALAGGVQINDAISISATTKAHANYPHLGFPLFAPGLRFEIAPEGGRFSIAFAVSALASISITRVAFSHLALATRAAWDFAPHLAEPHGAVVSFRLALEFATLAPIHKYATIGFAPTLSAGVVWR